MNCGFHRLFPLLITSALLAGCASSAERAAQRNDERCTARGLAPNTDAYNECLARLDTERSTRTEARRLEMLDKTTAPPLLPGR